MANDSNVMVAIEARKLPPGRRTMRYISARVCRGHARQASNRCKPARVPSGKRVPRGIAFGVIRWLRGVRIFPDAQFSERVQSPLPLRKNSLVLRCAVRASTALAIFAKAANTRLRSMGRTNLLILVTICIVSSLIGIKH